jgi:two-component system CheB/CheR fusion protein
VDDSEDTTEMVRHLLEIGGASVYAATSGFEALRIAREKEFDVVLSDISMPEMDGFEFLSRLRQIPGKEDLPAVALTGFGRPEDVQRASDKGFYAHLTKPFDIQRLAMLLQEVPRISRVHTE